QFRCSLDDAMDIAQVTFMRVFISAGTFKPDCEFYPWLFTIAKNVFFRAHKELRGLPFVGQTRNQAPDPGSYWQQQRVKDKLEDCMSYLSQRDREICIQWLEGVPTAKIALSFEIPEGTVRRIIHSVKRRFEKLRNSGDHNPGGDQNV